MANLWYHQHTAEAAAAVVGHGGDVIDEDEVEAAIPKHSAAEFADV